MVSTARIFLQPEKEEMPLGLTSTWLTRTIPLRIAALHVGKMGSTGRARCASLMSAVGDCGTDAIVVMVVEVVVVDVEGVSS